MSKSLQPEPQPGPQPSAEQEPTPDPILFYGTSWVDHSRGYGLRRAGLTLGALVLTAAGALVLWLGVVGLTGQDTAGWLRSLVVIALVLCGAMAFTRTWSGYARPRSGDQADESAFRSIKVIGFVGVLLAYALRGIVEAPGEKLRRLDYDAALERHRRTHAKRSGHPARRRRRPRS